MTERVWLYYAYPFIELHCVDVLDYVMLTVSSEGEAWSDVSDKLLRLIRCYFEVLITNILFDE